MKRILVTGGAGFVGSHLCRALLAQGHHVLCLDNFFTGRKKNIAEFESSKNFETIEHDIIEPINVEVEQIYNLACPASPVHYQFDAIKTTKTSVLGALHCLGLAKKLKARVFQASTSEIYGDPTQHPQREDYWGNVNTTGPRACYDEGKRVAETLFSDYHRQHGVDIRIARIFNTYGPQMHPNDGRVVSNFIVQALQNNDLTVYGQGEQTRSFCFVDDLVAGFIKLMEENMPTSPINLGNPSEMTVKALADEIIRLTESKSKVVYQELPQDDPVRRKPDIQEATRHLDWQPTVALEDGLKATIQYFKSELGQG